MKDHKYLSQSYWTYEKDTWVRKCIVDAFDAVGDHVHRLEAKIAKLEKASGRAGHRTR